MTLDGPFHGNIISAEDGPIDDVTNALLSSLVWTKGDKKPGASQHDAELK